LYREREFQYMTRGDLPDNYLWHVASVSQESARMATSGTTTGTPFRYLRWEPSLMTIEAENHYDLILDEFFVRENPHILNLFNSVMYDPSKLVTVRSDSTNFMDHHGARRRAKVHYANFAMMERDRRIYLSFIVKYLMSNEVDVVFAPGSTINAMCDIMRSHGVSAKLCHLVSNTNERMLRTDRVFLLGGRSTWVCDHMRSWDGGATFFTCRHGTYHLMDNLSWVEEVEGRLVSTDYFNLASPFLRYWNGDFCSLEDSYRRCGCGRLFRPFKFLESRPFSMKGLRILDLRKKIDELSISGIKRVICGLNTVDVVSSEKISYENMMAIKAVAENFDFRFLVE
jgi:phenylacetate-coenzyme A ligase PaaK-like adenylate-forming protein